MLRKYTIKEEEVEEEEEEEDKKKWGWRLQEVSLRTLIPVTISEQKLLTTSTAIHIPKEKVPTELPMP